MYVREYEINWSCIKPCGLTWTGSMHNNSTNVILISSGLFNCHILQKWNVKTFCVKYIHTINDSCACWTWLTNPVYCNWFYASTFWFHLLLLCLNLAEHSKHSALVNISRLMDDWCGKFLAQITSEMSFYKPNKCFAYTTHITYVWFSENSWLYITAASVMMYSVTINFISKVHTCVLRYSALTHHK